MRSVKLRTSDKKKVQEKLDLVIEKLMNLGGPENGEELAEGGEAIGFFKRDFGIREWDWPQGVGLYGLLRIMQARKNEDYKEFLYQWFKDNIRKGFPPKTSIPPRPFSPWQSLTGIITTRNLKRCA